MCPQDCLLVGQPVDDSLLAGEIDTILVVDYLVGATSACPVLAGPRARARLRPHLADHGRLYLVGLEPYVHSEPKPKVANI